MYKKNIVLSSAVALVISINAANAADCGGLANGYCLSDGNATFQIDAQGAMEMSVNGITHVFTTDFIFATNTLNVDNTINSAATVANNYESAALFDYIDLTFPGVTTASGSQLSLTGMKDTINTYNTWATVDIDFQLRGGAIGTSPDNASVIETFTITNDTLDGTMKSINLFAWTDVDVGGGDQILGYPDDEGEIVAFDSNGNPTAYRQFDDRDEVITTVSVAPDYYEVGISDGGECAGLSICDRVFNFSDVQLRNEVNVGSLPNDLNQAAEWVVLLAPGESFTFQHEMELNPVPVPAAVWLFGSGLIGLIGVARRKQQV